MKHGPGKRSVIITLFEVSLKALSAQRSQAAGALNTQKPNRAPYPPENGHIFDSIRNSATQLFYPMSIGPYFA